MFISRYLKRNFPIFRNSISLCEINRDCVAPFEWKYETRAGRGGGGGMKGERERKCVILESMIFIDCRFKYAFYFFTFLYDLKKIK